MKTNIKDKQNAYVVMRHDFDGKDVVCAVSPEQERAYELEGEFQQAFVDKGISLDESYFYTVLSTFYI